MDKMKIGGFMVKNELITQLSEKTHLTRKKCAEVYDSLVDTIYECMLKGESINLARLGKFEVKSKKSRKIINPSTKREMYIKAKKQPQFKASQALKDCMK